LLFPQFLITLGSDALSRVCVAHFPGASKYSLRRLDFTLCVRACVRSSPRRWLQPLAKKLMELAQPFGRWTHFWVCGCLVLMCVAMQNQLRR
jgi:hypothetical protein